MTTTVLPAVRPAHRDSNVLRWLTAYTASMLGDGVYFLALGFAAAKSLPPAEVGMVMATGSVPRAVLMLGGGVIADRFGPRRVVIGSDAVRCVLILSAAAALALTSPGLWLLVAVALLFGVVDALFLPAVGALPPRLVQPDQMMRLQGMRALAMRFGNIAGPPAGGLAMGLGGPSAAFATAGVLFAASVPLLVATRIGPLPAPGGAGDGSARHPDAEARAGAAGAGAGSRAGAAWEELRDGLRHVRRHRLVGPLVLSGAVCELGLAGPLNVGMVLLCQDRGWGSTGYGWIIAAFGAGSAAGALLLTVRGWLPKAGAVQIGTLLVSSTAIGATALAGSPVVAAAVALLAGLVGGVCGGLALALVQSAVDPSYLGRVTAVISLTGFGLAPLSYPVFGAAVAAWGPTPVFLAAAGFACLGALVGLASPAVRAAELSRPAGR
ncbi:MAG: MFS transporter [Actinomycetia bacterium]|nr:MFS transporter [Actinomycetes bacterium]